MNDPQPSVNPAFPRTAGVLDEALGLVEFLRAHCPWDASQTPRSLRRYLLEEAHEVVDAIDADDQRQLRDELGDLLLNVAFQIVIAEERRFFDRREVVDSLDAKMRRRHPHLFEGGEPAAWETLKARERGHSEPRDGLLGDVLPARDPVDHAFKLQARAATVGFDWPDATGAWEKVKEEVDEVHAELGAASPTALEGEIGDLLFAVVNLARLSGVHPTTALTRANAKFVRRFSRLEAMALHQGITLETAGLAVLDGLWDDVKREER